MEMIKAYTDYPIVAFGDIEGEEAPIREGYIVGYDGSLYCDFYLKDENGFGFIERIKSGYIYKRPARTKLNGPAPEYFSKNYLYDNFKSTCSS